MQQHVLEFERQPPPRNWQRLRNWKKVLQVCVFAQRPRETFQLHLVEGLGALPVAVLGAQECVPLEVSRNQAEPSAFNCAWLESACIGVLLPCSAACDTTTILLERFCPGIIVADN